MRYGVAIITWNSAGHIRPCLESCAETRPQPECGIVVVDNGSSDGTQALVSAFPGVRLLANTRNKGFAGAANQAFGAMPGAEAVLLLNPDARIASNIGALLAAFDDPRVAMSGGRLVNEDGAPQRGFNVRRFPNGWALGFETLGLNRLWPGNPVNRRYRCLDLDLQSPADVEQPAGAFVMVLRKAWEAVGGFDEGYYPLWFEDVDIAARLHQSGWKIRFEPAACAVHAGGHSIGSIPKGDKQLYWFRNLLRYSARHLSFAERWLVGMTVAAGSILRALGGVLSGEPKRSLSICANLIRLAAASLVSGQDWDPPLPEAPIPPAEPSALDDQS